MVTGVALHPAERRRIERALPPAAHHGVLLRPLGGGDARTMIATSRARSFVEALFEDLAADDWRARIAAMRGVRRGGDGVLELSLPTHRSYQIALFEILCAQPGAPRLDPARLASQGMVLRRRSAGGWAGWTRRGKLLTGWKRIDPDIDPEPEQRRAVHAANRSARALIAGSRPDLAPAEEVIPLFLAPPDICEARGRTILFGVVPVVSSERVDEAPPRLDYARHPQRAEFERHLSEFLKARAPTDLPRGGQALAAGWNVLSQVESGDPDQPRLRAIGLFLQQVQTELGVREGGAKAETLMGLLAGIELPTRRDSAGRTTATVDAATFVRRASAILLEGAANGDGFAMPLAWPRVDSGPGGRLAEAALECLSDQHSRLSARAGKFDDRADQFALRAFVRVRGHDGCPDTLLWSSYSEPFRVAAWWDGDGPVTKISLPDLSQLKKLKPNVTFEMPPSIANLLRGDMKKLSDGEGSEDDLKGLELGWLCSFSIPIITLCAFIVLNIFLSLFDIVFRWMAFIKICIPIPKQAE
jgi:hypothetical protein